MQSLLDALAMQQPENAANNLCAPVFVGSLQKVTPRQNISCRSCCPCCWLIMQQPEDAAVILCTAVFVGSLQKLAPSRSLLLQQSAIFQLH